jgi:glycerate kinase
LLKGCPIVRTATQPKRLLVASGAFAERLSAAAVGTAIARGLHEAGLPEPDLCPLPGAKTDGVDVRSLLDGLDFDRRMRASHAVIVATPRLRERALAGSFTFEIATRARQSGVPAYAITAENRLEPFDARILDLQVIVQARGARALTAAGRRLAAVV